jgi:hypothetical protein
MMNATMNTAAVNMSKGNMGYTNMGNSNYMTTPEAVMVIVEAAKGRDANQLDTKLFFVTTVGSLVIDLMDARMPERLNWWHVIESAWTKTM